MLRLVTVALSCLLSLPALADGGGLGSKDPGLYSLKGQIYFLPDGTEQMPEGIEKQPVKGTIYAGSLDVPARSFEEGFPGVTDRFEWFGIIYTGTFEVKKAGKYGFRLSSDDGTRLWIDGKSIIENDGIHGVSDGTGEVQLAAGRHDMKVWYYQGPANEIALQLFITAPGSEEKIFSMEEYAGALKNAVKGLDAKVSAEGIKIALDAAVLFDTGKHDLKPKAQESIKKLVAMLEAYPSAAVTIVGHTDDEGKDEDNQGLSERRAASVKAAIEAAGAPKTLRIESSGAGEKQPIADNKTPKGRAKNRRVEIVVRP